MYRILQKTKQRLNNKEIYGFDIETYGEKNDFYCASLYNNNFKKTIFSIKELIELFKTPRFKNTIISATNLQFDFMGTIGKTDDINNFFIRFRGSDLILARAYIFKNNFYRKKPVQRNKDYVNYKPVVFLDTLNYARLSVQDIGKIINISKMEKPSFLGSKPKTEDEKNYLIKYNMKDAEISCKFIEFLYDSFRKLGGTPKITIASSALALWKNRFLNTTFFRHETEKLIEEFKAYYGGRCEAFKRGMIENYNYYDFNSLYPSVMLNEFPNPNTLRVNHLNEFGYIENFDGISLVEVHCPKNIFPLLPYRYDNKLLFPNGTFTGWFTNVELRKAHEIGYVIKKIYKTFYFKENCIPFYSYVKELYDERLRYKKENNPMESVIKLVMNSLYGKFGEKFTNRDEWIPLPDTLEELRKIKDFERVGNFLRVKKDLEEPKPYCIPIWCSYVTAYGRIKLYESLIKSAPVYCDTDSIITKKDIPTSEWLGKLKLEMRIKKGIIVKPKFYALIDEKDNEVIKIKGIGRHLDYMDFMKILKNPDVRYTKFMKFKESLRRGFIPNEIVVILKHLSLEDNKRYWQHDFNYRALEISKAIEIF